MPPQTHPPIPLPSQQINQSPHTSPHLPCRSPYSTTPLNINPRHPIPQKLIRWRNNDTNNKRLLPYPQLNRSRPPHPLPHPPTILRITPQSTNNKKNHINNKQPTPKTTLIQINKPLLQSNLQPRSHPNPNSHPILLLLQNRIILSLTHMVLLIPTKNQKYKV